MVTKTDCFHKGKPTYPFDGKSAFPDVEWRGGLHYIYVNGAYEDTTTEIGQLIHDLSCSDPDEMYLDWLADEVRKVKTDESEVNKMSEILEQEFQEGLKKGQKKGRDEVWCKNVSSLVKSGMSIEEAFELLEAPTKVQKRVRAALAKS